MYTLEDMKIFETFIFQLQCGCWCEAVSCLQKLMVEFMNICTSAKSIFSGFLEYMLRHSWGKVKSQIRSLSNELLRVYRFPSPIVSAE